MTTLRFPLTGRFLLGRARHVLSEREKAILEDCVSQPERAAHGTIVLRRGQEAHRSTMLVEGYIARVIERDGRRHIVALQVPGDFVDLHAFALKRLDHDVVAVGPVKLAYVPHDRLSEILSSEPHLSRLLWFSTLLDAAIHREWILTLEGLPVEGRLAHLLAEIWHRLDMVGLGGGDSFALPLTQVQLADACGTGAVHLNRVARRLREDGVVDFRRGRVRVLDKALLAERGSFNPSYLYGRGELNLLESVAART